MVEIIFIADILLISIALLWLIAASVTDLKKREVPNWISFSLFAVAFAIRGIAAITEKQSFYFTYALIAFAIFFLLANLFYYTRVFGGGDAKLLIALSVVFATKPSFISTTKIIENSCFIQEPFLATFLIKIFVLGSVYGLFFTIFSALKSKNFGYEFKKTHKKARLFRSFSWLIAFVCLVLGFFSSNWFFVSFAVFLILPYLYIFIKAAENSTMVRKVLPKKLCEGDWIIESVKVKNRIIKPSIHGLSKKDIALIRKTKKPVTVKYGLPFVPVFLVALLCGLFIGDLLYLMIHFLFGI